MSRAQIEWTRELLEEVMGLEGGEAHRAFADRLGIKTNTVYSMRSRLYDEGIEEVLERARRRYTTYEHTKEDRLAGLKRIYTMRASRAGRGGRIGQYTITVPPAAAESWIERFGPAVRWEFDEEGARLIPVNPEVDVPSWLSIEGDDGT